MGAAHGGPLGYASYSEKNDPAENTMRGGAGAVLGAGTNVAAPYVASGLMQGAQGLWNMAGQGVNAVRNALTPQVTINQNIRTQLQAAGVDLNALSTQAQAAISAEAQAQLRAGGTLNAEQLLRNADIETIAGPGSALRGQVTRSPQDWSIERNLQRTEANLPSVRTGAQETVTGRLQAQDEAMRNFSAQIAQGTGGRSATPLEAGASAIEAVQSNDAARNRVVNELYKAYRETGMKGAPVAEDRLTAALTDVIENRGVETLPPAVVTRLKEFAFLGGNRTRYLTIDEADKFNRLLNANNPGFGPASGSIAQLKTALERSLHEVPIGKDASQALLTARNAAAEMFSAREAGAGVSRAIADVAPDKFMQLNVLGGSVRDLQALRSELGDSQAWNNLRQQAWQWIQGESTGHGRQAFSGARLDETLRQLGPERLRVLFSPAEMQQIETLRRGAMAMTTQPLFSAVNYSNTTPALMGQLMRMGNRIPGLNLLTGPMTQEIENSATQRLLNQSLSGAQGASAATQSAQQEAARAAAIRMLFQQRGYAGAAGAALPPALAAQYQGSAQR
jgi:hypothetical protein